jgi:hypothetical protein
MDMITRWRRIRKQFLTSIVRFIPKEEAFEIFDTLDKYENGLRDIMNLTKDSKDLSSKAIHKICVDSLKDW